MIERCPSSRVLKLCIHGTKDSSIVDTHIIYSKSMLLENKNLPVGCTEREDSEKICPKLPC